MDTFLAVLFVIICVLLIIVVLLQKGRGGGIGAAFGGSSSSAFGTRTGDVFTWVTIVLTALFLLLAIGATVAYRPAPQDVAAPMFNPPAGPITDPIAVSIGCHSPGATIYYTLDGSEPTQKSLQYRRQPVPVEPGQVLKAKAFRRNWADSKVAVAEYPRPGAQPTTTQEGPEGPASGPASKPSSGPTTGAAGTSSAPTSPGSAPATQPARPAQPTTRPA
jgi:preprotein translocase subunit SecG